MKLQITRKQTEETDRKGRSEGVQFEFSCQLDLDAHEQELVERYRQGRFPITFLMTDDIRDYQPRNHDDRNLSVDLLAEGWSVQSKFATDLQRTEAKIKEECENFKALLLALESYGGQEEIEF
jgi:hypothetical protein